MRILRTALRHQPSPVEFCDRCSTVCDARCRTERLRDQAVLRALTAGSRP